MPKQNSHARPELSSEAAKLPEEQLNASAEALALSLRAYADAAQSAYRPQRDADVIAARQRIDLARKLIRDSGIANALASSIPDHVRYWASWINREDFTSHVGFEATDISAVAKDDGKGSIIEFTFNSNRYRLVVSDFGRSSYGQHGEVELFLAQKRVAKIDVRRVDKPEYSYWQFSDVRALKVGDWMKDVLDIAAQIEAPGLKSLEDFLAGHWRSDDQVREVASEIDLG